MQLNLTSQSTKRSFSVDEVQRILSALGSDSPRASPDGRALMFQTVCHNPAHEGSFKLYYYTDSGMFHCYTHCGDSFDVYELIQRHNHCTFYQALLFIQSTLGISFERKAGIQTQLVDDWDIINKYTKKKSKPTETPLPYVPKQLLSLYQTAYPVEWQRDNITPEAMDKYGIRFDVSKNEIIIPHYDVDGGLIGIRSRSLVKEVIDAGCKYMPTQLEDRDFRHTLRNNLYGLDKAKGAIQRIGKIMICESEKASLQGYSYYGENNFIVSACGSHISLWQRDKILSLGIREVFIAFDKEYHEAFTPESDNYAEKILHLAGMFSPYLVTYVIWDCEGLLDYKDSPTDKGRNVLEKLMANKFEITTNE